MERIPLIGIYVAAANSAGEVVAIVQVAPPGSLAAKELAIAINKVGVGKTNILLAVSLPLFNL